MRLVGLFLGLRDARLVIDELVKCQDRLGKASDKDHCKMVSGRNSEGLHSLVIVDIGKQIEDILKGVIDWVTSGELAFKDFSKVSINLVKLTLQRLEGSKFIGDLSGEASGDIFFDIAKQMLNTDFFSLLRLDSAVDMSKCPGSGSSILTSCKYKE